MESLYCYFHSNVITTNFCCAVKACATICSDLMDNYWITVVLISHQIWIASKKSLVKSGPCTNYHYRFVFEKFPIVQFQQMLYYINFRIGCQNSVFPSSNFVFEIVVWNHEFVVVLKITVCMSEMVYILLLVISQIFDWLRPHFDGFVQERHNSSAFAMELRCSCTNPLIW